MKYSKGYKYQLRQNEVFHTAIKPTLAIYTEFIYLGIDGTLVVAEAYCWDGCSGPTWDDRTNMRAGLAHDALCQLLRMGLLDQEWRKAVDEELYSICIEDGMNPIRAWLYWFGVGFCSSCSEVGNDPYPTLEAP